MSLENRFYFIGDIKIPKDKDKFYKTYEPEDKSYQIHTVTFMVQESPNNGVWVELNGFKPNKSIKTTGVYNKETKKSAKLDIPVDKRFDADQIEKVANFAKTFVDTGEGEKQFISSYDAVVYLATRIPEMLVEGKVKLKVSGTIENRVGKGKVYTSFVPSRVRMASPDDENVLDASMVLYYNKDSYDKSRFDDEKKIDFFAYVQDYDRPSKSNKYFPMSFVYNAEGHKKERVQYIVKNLKTDESNMLAMRWKIKVFNGAEEVEFDESMLTDAQKEEIAIGLSTIDDFRPSGNPLGGNTREYRLFRPDLKDTKFSEGAFETGLTADEFAEQIVAMEKVDKKQDEKVSNKVVDDLFEDDTVVDDDEDWL